MARRRGADAPKVLMIRTTGYARSGKSTLGMEFARYCMAQQAKSELYLISNDGREDEYHAAFGNAVVEPWPQKADAQATFTTLDAAAVYDCVANDVKGGEFKRVGCVLLDNATNYFLDTTKATQVKAQQGQGSAGSSTKAAVMGTVATFLMKPQKPIFVISHEHDAAGRNASAGQKKRETISNTELSRMDRCFNLELEVIEDKGRYGVKVLFWRYKPDLKPFVVWDEKGMFEGIFDILLEALEGNQAQEVAPDEIVDINKYGANNPFPGDKDTFKANVGRICMRYFVEHDGHKFYAFGGGEFGVDLDAQVTKKNGEQGANGAPNHFDNAYAKIAKSIEGKKTYGVMSEAMKKYVLEKIQGRIVEYEAAKNGGAPAPEDPAPEEEPEFDLS